MFSRFKSRVGPFEAHVGHGRVVSCFHLMRSLITTTHLQNPKLNFSQTRLKIMFCPVLAEPSDGFSSVYGDIARLVAAFVASKILRVAASSGSALLKQATRSWRFLLYVVFYSGADHQ